MSRWLTSEEALLQSAVRTPVRVPIDVVTSGGTAHR